MAENAPQNPSDSSGNAFRFQRAVCQSCIQIRRKCLDGEPGSGRKPLINQNRGGTAARIESVQRQIRQISLREILDLLGLLKFISPQRTTHPVAAVAHRR